MTSIRRPNSEIGRAHVWTTVHYSISYAVFCLKKKVKKRESGKVGAKVWHQYVGRILVLTHCLFCDINTSAEFWYHTHCLSPYPGRRWGLCFFNCWLTPAEDGQKKHQKFSLTHCLKGKKSVTSIRRPNTGTYPLFKGVFTNIGRILVLTHCLFLANPDRRLN